MRHHKHGDDENEYRVRHKECFEMEIGHLTPDTHLKCKKNKKKQKKNSKKAVNE